MEVSTQVKAEARVEAVEQQLAGGEPTPAAGGGAAEGGGGGSGAGVAEALVRTSSACPRTPPECTVWGVSATAHSMVRLDVIGGARRGATEGTPSALAVHQWQSHSGNPVRGVK